MIVVLTAPHRPEYVRATLLALDAEGAAGQPKLLCVDGNIRDLLRARIIPAGWEMVSVGAGGQATRVAFHGVCAAVAKRGGSADVLYFEDDVIPCKNAVAGLALIPVPDDCGFLVAFDHRNVIKTTDPQLLRLASDSPGPDGRVRGYWGNQALKLPMRTIEHLAQQTTRGGWGKSTPRSLSYGADIWLGQHAASKTAPWHVYGLLAPSLFQHVGGVSAVNKHWKIMGRTADNWRADFDALGLAEQLDAGTV